MATSHRPSPLSFDANRQSPFKRQNSGSPATIRATTPTQTSPSKLSPEKQSPFVRRPSNISQSPSTRSRATPTPEPYADDESVFGTSTARPSPAALVAPPTLDGTTQDTRPNRAPLQPIAAPNFQPPKPKLTTTTTITTKTTTTTTKPALSSGTTAYKNVPQPLLRSMRESFDVLDSNNTNAIDSAAVANMLEQMGMDATPSALTSFFPPNMPAQLNLARYLDTLSAPMAELSPPEELMAAFSAFDIDDSGQIDVQQLRRALLETAPELGEEDYRLSERELEGILGEFSGRRAFGAKGVNVAKGKGEVFRYREFMGAVMGGPGGEGEGVGLEGAA